MIHVLHLMLRFDVAAAGAFGLLALTASEPIDSGIVTIVVAAIAAVVSLGTAFMTMVVLIRTSRIADQSKQTHDLVDGKMTQLVDGLKAQGIADVGRATAEGILAGEASQRERGMPPHDNPRVDQ